ncbi:MAG: CoA transferase [Myxococcota bacterium]|nr:CoA transferase [Myxococcota bacterium]MDW8362681.1 CaiB/BaiF CoA-transferase family protein [Myxococcales bacterium]
MRERPLSGLRVVDLSRLLPGPLATLVLSDLGADVVKVEDPAGGDYLRHLPPQIDGTNAVFIALNRGKRSVALDLKRSAGREALLRLCERSDVLVESFRPGVLARLGLGPDVLRERCPRLVVASLTGYGQQGPLASRAGHDVNYVGRSGLLGVSGPAGALPAHPGGQVADVGGALACVVAVLAALLERQKTGRGAYLDVSLRDSAALFALVGLCTAWAGGSTGRGLDALTGGIAPYGIYSTADDRFVTLAALEPKFWSAFCAAVGLQPAMEALLPGPHQREHIERLRTLFSTRTREAWTELGAAHDCCLEPVLEPGEVRDDPELRARGLVADIAGGSTRTTVLRTPVALDAVPGRVPRLGEHTEEVLREIGFDEGRIAEARGARTA